MNEGTRVLRKRQEIVTRRVAGETLLIPIRGRLADLQRIFALDPVAEHVWERLDGSADLDAIRGSVLAAFDVGEEQAGRDIAEFVAALESAGLVESV